MIDQFIGSDCKLLEKTETCTLFECRNNQLEETKFVAFYFSAHWCPPCRRFTPKLVEFYNNVNRDEKHFEVIFVSGDRTDEEFIKYYETMPWLALPLSETDRNENLQEKFGVQGIPMLVVINTETGGIYTDARSAVQNWNTDEDSYSVLTEWKS
uniref:Thioredoxin-like protein n=1 Tax=Megaviridae environmental sample TaxID=1737588 RepID=A0A5J6VIA0_9VIRU|nr:MAG: thioredoxin-like protein [Megaviridae environmental sample]